MKQEQISESKKAEVNFDFDNISKLTSMSNIEEWTSGYEMEMMEMMEINKN